MRFWAFCVGALLFGCSAKNDKVDLPTKAQTSQDVYQADQAAKEEGIAMPKEVNASPGEATRLGANRQKLWTVRWKGARLDFTEGGRFSGYMDRVTGSIYGEKGQETSAFQGERGEADKAKDILRLSGSVKILSKEHKATLFCDKLEYEPERKRVRAVGNVRIESQSGVLNAGNEILATPDLTHVATPNLF